MKIIASLLAVVAGWLLVPGAVRAQTPAGVNPADGWTARMSALDEERATQTGVAVSIIFDDSGSMADNNKLPMAKTAFRAWIEKAPADYRFGLVALNAGELVKLKRDDKTEVLAAVKTLRANGGTPLARAIAQTGKEIRARRAAGASYERQVVVIITDGADNTSRGIPGVQEEITRLRGDGVEVVAFGYQGEGEYMRDCATHYFSPNNDEEIRRGLAVIGSEAGDPTDIRLDDATRAEMGKSVPPAVGQPMAVVDTPKPTATPFAAAATPAPASAAKSSKGGGFSFSFGWILVLFWIAFALFGRSKRK